VGVGEGENSLEHEHPTSCSSLKIQKKNDQV